MRAKKPTRAQFLAALRKLAPEDFQALADCAREIEARPVPLAGDEIVRRMALALGYSEGAALALTAPSRRARFRVVEGGGSAGA